MNNQLVKALIENSTANSINARSLAREYHAATGEWMNWHEFASALDNLAREGYVKVSYIDQCGTTNYVSK